MKGLLGQKAKRKLPSSDSLDGLVENFSEYFHSKIVKIREGLDKNDAAPEEVSSFSVLPLAPVSSQSSMQSFQPLTK